MKDFTVKMALVDAIPVILFSLSLISVCRHFDPLLFIAGAVLIILAGLCKVVWKFILGAKRKDIAFLSKLFVPFMSAGFLTVVVSLIIYRSRINLSVIFASMISMPAVIFFALFIVGITVMIICATRFKRNDAKDNWRAQFINIFVQAMLLIALSLV